MFGRFVSSAVSRAHRSLHIEVDAELVYNAEFRTTRIVMPMTPFLSTCVKLPLRSCASGYNWHPRLQVVVMTRKLQLAGATVY